MTLQLLNFFFIFEDIFAAFIFRVKIVSFLKVLFAVKQTFPHCLTVFLMKLCELIKYSSGGSNKILKALLSFYALFEITCVCSVISGSIEKKPLSSFSFFFFFFLNTVNFTLFQIKEDCIVLLTCTDTCETVCSESIDSKY